MDTVLAVGRGGFTLAATTYLDDTRNLWEFVGICGNLWEFAEFAPPPGSTTLISH